jgi:hypothetical protein
MRPGNLILRLKRIQVTLSAVEPKTIVLILSFVTLVSIWAHADCKPPSEDRTTEGIDALFTLLVEHYEHGSVLLTCNLLFSKWDAS